MCVCGTGSVYSTEMRVVLVVCTVWRCVCGIVYSTEMCVVLLVCTVQCVQYGDVCVW